MGVGTSESPAVSTLAGSAQVGRGVPTSTFSIVGIGASAGGIEALREKLALAPVEQIATRGGYGPRWLWQQAGDV